MSASTSSPFSSNLIRRFRLRGHAGCAHSSRVRALYDKTRCIRENPSRSRVTRCLVPARVRIVSHRIASHGTAALEGQKHLDCLLKTSMRWTAFMIAKNVAVDNLNASKDALREAEATRKVRARGVSFESRRASSTRRDPFHKVATRLRCLKR